MIEKSKPSIHIGRPPDKHVTKPLAGNSRPSSAGVLRRLPSANTLTARPPRRGK